MRNFIAAFLLFFLLHQPAKAYTVDSEFAANNCEFYVNGLVLVRGYYYFHWEYIKSWIQVNEKDLVERQGGEILGVGMRANGKDFIFGKKHSPSYFMIQTDMKPLDPSSGGGYRPGTPYDLRNFSYFLDVKRSTGLIHRLWITNAGHDFSWPQVYDGYPNVIVTEETIGRGNAFALKNDMENSSPIFNQRKACVR